MEHPKIAALTELGILCVGEEGAVHGPGDGDNGPHVFSAHDQLSRYENPTYQFPYEDQSQAAYTFYPSEMDMQTALGQTRLIVMLGAANSEQLKQCLDKPDTLVLLFEPDKRVLMEFLESIPLMRLSRNGVFVFTGDPYGFSPAIQDMLPSSMFKQGTPAFFLTDRIAQAYPEWADNIIEYLEILHYRHAIYPVSGQILSWSRPVRDITRVITYDQQLHLFANIPDYLVQPELGELKDRLSGHTAILVAAGPDLNAKIDFIRANREKAVVISVNNALKPLSEAGIQPHFAVINDHSIAAGEVFDHIPAMPETILVGHCLSELGGDKFKQKYIFGEHMPEVFGQRDDLELHGSVISTAFSLAEHMGCVKCILIGAQLASDNPWGLGYAKGTLKKEVSDSGRPLVGRHPQLYPVQTPGGETLYTTLNFRDAALWLSEVVRQSGVECVNTTKSSILFGRGIGYDPDPKLADRDVGTAFGWLFKVPTVSDNLVRAATFVEGELESWAAIRAAAEQALNETGPWFVENGMELLRKLDANNVTFLVERYRDFNNALFHSRVFGEQSAQLESGLRYYLESVEAMSNGFVALLDAVREKCRRLQQESGE